MKSKAPHLIALILAGITSVLLSFVGIFLLLWGGFPKQHVPGPVWAIVGSMVLSFPLFIVAVGISKLGCIGLWSLAPIQWLGYLLMAQYSASFWEMVKSTARTVATPSMFGLLAVAAAVQYGTSSYELPLDRRMATRKESA